MNSNSNNAQPNALLATNRSIVCIAARMLCRPIRVVVGSISHPRRSIAARLGCTLSQHKGYVATWEIPWPRILGPDRDFSVETYNFEKYVITKNSLLRQNSSVVTNFICRSCALASVVPPYCDTIALS